MISWSDVILFKIRKKLNKIDEFNLSKKDEFISKKAEECPPQNDNPNLKVPNNLREERDVFTGAGENKKVNGSYFLTDNKNKATRVQIGGKLQYLTDLEDAQQSHFEISSSWNGSRERVLSMGAVIYPRVKRQVSTAKSPENPDSIEITEELRNHLKFPKQKVKADGITTTGEKTHTSQSEIQKLEYSQHSTRIINNRMYHAHNWHVGKGDNIPEEEIPQHFKDNDWMQKGVKNIWDGIGEMHVTNLESMMSQTQGGNKRGISGVLNSFTPLKNSANLNTADRVLKEGHLSEMEMFQGDDIDETLKKSLLAKQQLSIASMATVENVYNHSVKKTIEVPDPKNPAKKITKEITEKTPIDIQYSGAKGKEKLPVSVIHPVTGEKIEGESKVKGFLEGNDIETVSTKEMGKKVKSSVDQNDYIRSFFTDEEKSTLENNPSSLFKKESFIAMKDFEMERNFISSDAHRGYQQRMLNGWHNHHLDDKAGEAESFDQIRDYELRVVDKSGQESIDVVPLRDVSSPDWNLAGVPEAEHLDLNHNTAEKTILKEQFPDESRSTNQSREENVVRMDTITMPDGVDDDNNVFFTEVYLNPKEAETFYKENPDWDENIREYQEKNSKKYLNDEFRSVY